MLFDHDLYTKLKGYKVILGLLSPRRKEILQTNLGIKDFTIVKSTFEEDIGKDGLSDVDYVMQTAQAKIPSIIDQLENEKCVIIVADTIVSCQGKVFEKPGTPDVQLAMLKTFRSEGSVKVVTSVHVIVVEEGEQRLISGHETTHLLFNTSLSDEELQNYVNCKEGLEVAGGFQFQSLGNLLFTGLEGDYFNVVGLPAAKTFSLLRQAMENREK